MVTTITIKSDEEEEMIAVVSVVDKQGWDIAMKQLESRTSYGLTAGVRPTLWNYFDYDCIALTENLIYGYCSVQSTAKDPYVTLGEFVDLAEKQFPI